MEQSIIVGLHDTNFFFQRNPANSHFTETDIIGGKGMSIRKIEINTRFSFKYRTGVQSSIKIENFVELKKEVYTTQQKSFR